jgi:hypothetical protein
MVEMASRLTDEEIEMFVNYIGALAHGMIPAAHGSGSSWPTGVVLRRGVFGAGCAGIWELKSTAVRLYLQPKSNPKPEYAKKYSDCRFRRPRSPVLSASAQDKVDFEKQVYPLIKASCVQCHRPEHESPDRPGRKI